MKLLIFKNNKWQSLIMRWNYKQNEKSQIECSEVKDQDVLNVLNKSKDTVVVLKDNEIVVSGNGKVL